MNFSLKDTHTIGDIFKKLYLVFIVFSFDTNSVFTEVKPIHFNSFCEVVTVSRAGSYQ